MPDTVDFPRAGSRMAGLDGLHLHMETDQTPTHTLKIFVLNALPGAEPLEARDAVSAFRRTAEAFPFFRMIALPTPLGIDQPLWSFARDVDLAHHIKVRTLPAPGGRKEFDATVGDLTESRLTRDRPLWQAWVLDGLAEGRIAVVLKLHHTLADGVAAANQLAMITGDDAWPDRAAGETAPIPGRWSILGRATRERARRLRRLPALVRATRQAAREIRALELPPLGIPGPRNRLRGAVAPGRSFATIHLSLEDVRSARAAATGATINDVVLTLVGGALRAVLGARGELPMRSLLAVVPISTDPPDAPPRLWGNGFSQMFTTLGTDIANPVDRLAAIHEVTAGSKQTQQRLGDLSARWFDQIPPLLLRGSLLVASRLGLSDRIPLPGVSVSNVRGPAEHIRLPRWGFEIAELFSVGPVLNGTGVNITAWSYDGRLQVVALAASSLLSDAHNVTDAMAAELERLVAAVDRVGDYPYARDQQPGVNDDVDRC